MLSTERDGAPTVRATVSFSFLVAMSSGQSARADMCLVCARTGAESSCTVEFWEGSARLTPLSTRANWVSGSGCLDSIQGRMAVVEADYKAHHSEWIYTQGAPIKKVCAI